MENSDIKKTEPPNNSITIDYDGGTQKELNGAEMALALAKDFIVNSQSTYELAAGELRNVKDRYNQLDTKRKELTRPLDKLKKEWIEFFRPALGVLEYAEKIYKNKMIAFADEQERIRRKAEAEAREKARKEQEALEKRAAKAASSGKNEKADMLRAQAEYVQQPIVNTQKPVAKGVSVRGTWHAEVSNKMELIKAVAAGKIPHLALEPNITFLNKQARAMEKELNYPGVVAVHKKGISARR